MKNKLLLMLGIVLLAFVVIVFAVAPNQPELNSPTNNSINNTDAVNLSVTVTDDDSNLMNVSFYWGINELCYQETPNVSTACGGLNTGNYFYDNNWDTIESPTHLVDGNWDSWTARNAGGGVTAYFYINYTKPINALNTSLWQVKVITLGTINYSIPSTCWNYSNDILRFEMKSIFPAGLSFGCYNGVDYSILGSVGGNEMIYEEAMWWDTNIYIGNDINIANGSTSTYEWTDLADGVYNWYAVVTDGLNSTTSDVWTFTLDTSIPSITTNGINLNKTYVYSNDNFTAQINLSDINLYSINISLNDSAIFGTTGLSQSLYVYNLSQNISSYGTGVHNLSVRVCDGHTDSLLKDAWDYDISLGSLTYKDGKKWYRINPTNADIFEKISTTKLTDRYTFEYSKSAIGKLLSGNTYTFIVESSEYIDIIDNRPQSKYDAWMVIPSMERWIDFNLKDIKDAKYTVKRLNDKQVEVTITNVPKDIKELVFESTGELNCVTETYEFYIYDYTATHDLTVLETSSQTFTLNITKDSDYITDANATLHYNGTDYTPTETTNGSYFLFSKTLTMPSITNSTNVTFNWTYTLVGNENITNRTNTYTQQIYNIDIDDCSTYSIVALNFSLIEESNNASIAGDMDFTFSLVQEGITINYSKSVTGINSTAFCIPTDEVSFTAQLQSEYTASAYDSFTYFAYNLAVTNATQYIYYYLTNGTTIVEFTVLDQSGNKIENAYIKVMKYNIGTGLYKTIEILKTDELGKTLGNIVLDTEWYKFIVEYNGITYLTTSATKLTSTTRTFTINLLSDFFDRFTDVIYNIYSTLNYTDATGNFAFTYSDPNGNYHRGCLKVTKESLAGQTLINETCVESTAATILVNVNSSGNINGTYTAVGYIMFSDMYVLQTLSKTWGHLSDKFGKEGLFYVFFIVLTTVMVGIFSPKLAVILGVIGLVFSNILGFIFINAGWLVAIIIAAGLTLYRMRD